MKLDLIVAAAFAVVSAIAVAASPKVPSFSELDKDVDGFVSRAEAAMAKELAARFDEADADKDDKLSKAEFDAAVQKLQKSK